MLYPLFREEKVANIAVFDAVATKVELVEGNYVLWKNVANFLVDTEFTRNGFLGSCGALSGFGKRISVAALSF
jgi:hypothetical protein